MNKVHLMGRLTANPDITYTTGDEPTEMAKYQLAVNRRYKREETPADFFRCLAFGKQAEFTEKYLKKGMKIIITGRLQTGSYMNPQGQKVYTTDVIVEEQEFAESKAVNEERANKGTEEKRQEEEFMEAEGELPFQ